MACKNVCKLCPNLVISTAVAYDAGTDTLNITLPETICYANCRKVCFVVAQAIPATTTRTALVNIIVGDGTFPLVKCDCSQASACEISTRTKYSTKVLTNTVSGTFRLLGKVYPCCPDNLAILPTTTTPAGGEGA